MRDRWYLLSGIAGAVAVPAFPGILPAVLVAALLVVVWESISTSVRATGVRSRPAAFAVGRRRFSARLLATPASLLILPWIAMGALARSAIGDLRDPDPAAQNAGLAGLASLVLLGALTIGLTVLCWTLSRAGLELTPEGLIYRSLFSHRFIPWEALAPGGPERPGERESHLRLGYARPELVSHHRFSFTRKDRGIINALDVHPWLVADAIRWYAEHPEDRAAIGTAREHERLLAAVGVQAYPVPAVVALNPLTRNAVRVACAGAAFGVLTAAADLAVVLVFPGEGDVQFGQTWSGLVLGLTLILALVAVRSARRLAKGDDAARFNLIAVAVIAAVWAAIPCLDPAMDAAAELQVPLLTLMVVKRLGCLAFAIATLVLLLLRSQRQPVGPDRGAAPDLGAFPG